MARAVFLSAPHVLYMPPPSPFCTPRHILFIVVVVVVVIIIITVSLFVVSRLSSLHFFYLFLLQAGGRVRCSALRCACAFTMAPRTSSRSSRQRFSPSRHPLAPPPENCSIPGKRIPLRLFADETSIRDAFDDDHDDGCTLYTNNSVYR